MTNASLDQSDEIVVLESYSDPGKYLTAPELTNRAFLEVSPLLFSRRLQYWKAIPSLRYLTPSSNWSSTLVEHGSLVQLKLNNNDRYFSINNEILWRFIAVSTKTGGRM
eukprot:PhF_6_TR18946/c0_g1_i1/m.27770